MQSPEKWAVEASVSVHKLVQDYKTLFFLESFVVSMPRCCSSWKNCICLLQVELQKSESN